MTEDAVAFVDRVTVVPVPRQLYRQSQEFFSVVASLLIFSCSSRRLGQLRKCVIALLLTFGVREGVLQELDGLRCCLPRVAANRSDGTEEACAEECALLVHQVTYAASAPPAETFESASSTSPTFW